MDRSSTNGVFASLLQKYAPEEDVIQKDLHRTFPEHFLFREESGPGQKQLFRVLKAFCVYNSSVGYCQGMAFITASLLMYLDEEDVFWILVRLCERDKIYHMYDLWDEKMSGLPKRLYIFNRLLETALPKVYDHFKTSGIEITLYATPWFVCVFTYSQAFPLALRLFDLFLAFGHDSIYFSGLAMLKLLEDKLFETKDMLQLLSILKQESDGKKDMATYFKPHDVITYTLGFRKKYKSKLDQLKKDAEKNPNIDFHHL